MSEVTESGISRSKLLKRAAIVGGAAAVWSAPFVTSAGAATTAGLTRTKCRTNPTDFSGSSLRCTPCSQGIKTCGTAPNGTSCFCFVGRSGCCECQGDYFCSGATICTSNAGCPAGFKCVSSCCDSVVSGYTCAPPCGSGISSAEASSGARASG